MYQQLRYIIVQQYGINDLYNSARQTRILERKKDSVIRKSVIVISYKKKFVHIVYVSDSHGRGKSHGMYEEEKGRERTRERERESERERKRAVPWLSNNYLQGVTC